MKPTGVKLVGFFLRALCRRFVAQGPQCKQAALKAACFVLASA
jgi:hypothetical protein